MRDYCTGRDGSQEVRRYVFAASRAPAVFHHPRFSQALLGFVRMWPAYLRREIRRHPFRSRRRELVPRLRLGTLRGFARALRLPTGTLRGRSHRPGVLPGGRAARGKSTNEGFAGPGCGEREPCSPFFRRCSDTGLVRCASRPLYGSGAGPQTVGGGPQRDGLQGQGKGRRVKPKREVRISSRKRPDRGHPGGDTNR